MVYYGFWFTPKMDALTAFIRQPQHVATGRVGAGPVQGKHPGHRPQRSEQPL